MLNHTPNTYYRTTFDLIQELCAQTCAKTLVNQRSLCPDKKNRVSFWWVLFHLTCRFHLVATHCIICLVDFWNQRTRVLSAGTDLENIFSFPSDLFFETSKKTKQLAVHWYRWLTFLNSIRKTQSRILLIC